MIHFQDIQFRYEGTISSEIGVKDINLIVHTGECVLLCGRSGCGKTTLTKLINGLIPNYFPGELSGNVQIDDENILGMPMWTVRLLLELKTSLFHRMNYISD